MNTQQQNVQMGKHVCVNAAVHAVLMEKIRSKRLKLTGKIKAQNGNMGQVGHFFVLFSLFSLQLPRHCDSSVSTPLPNTNTNVSQIWPLCMYYFYHTMAPSICLSTVTQIDLAFSFFFFFFFKK